MLILLTQHQAILHDYQRTSYKPNNQTINIINHFPKTDVILFHAGWCGDCKREVPKIKNIIQRLPRLNFTDVAVDHSKNDPDNHSGAYDVRYIPTLIIESQGRQCRIENQPSKLRWEGDIQKCLMRIYSIEDDDISDILSDRLVIDELWHLSTAESRIKQRRDSMDGLIHLLPYNTYIFAMNEPQAKPKVVIHSTQLTTQRASASIATQSTSETRSKIKIIVKTPQQLSNDSSEQKQSVSSDKPQTIQHTPKNTVSGAVDEQQSLLLSAERSSNSQIIQPVSRKIKILGPTQTQQSLQADSLLNCSNSLMGDKIPTPQNPLSKSKITILQSQDQLQYNKQKTETEQVSISTQQLQFYHDQVAQSFAVAEFLYLDEYLVRFAQYKGLQQDFALPANLREFIDQDNCKVSYQNDKNIFTYKIDKKLARQIEDREFEEIITRPKQIQCKVHINPFPNILPRLQDFSHGNIEVKQLIGITIPTTLKLFEHQQAALEQARKYKKFAFLDSPGLGKSLPALIFLLQKNRPIFIVAPQILHETWYKTFKQLNIQTCDDISVFYQKQANNCWTFLSVKQAQRIKNIVTIFNNGTLVKLIIIITHTELKKMTETGIILQNSSLLVDEFQDYKEVSSQRAQFILAMLKIVPSCALLTATPALNNVLELYPLLASLNLNISQKQFEQRYCIIEKRQINNKTINQVIGSRNIDELKFLLHKFSICRNYNALENVPDIQRQVLNLQIPPMLQHASLVQQRSLVASLLASEFISYIRKFNQKCVIFFANLAAAEKLQQVCKVITGSTGITQRIAIINEFQTGQLQKIAISLECAAVGIDLAVCRFCFFLQLDWTASITIQAEGRIRRVSNKAKTVYSILVSGGSSTENRIMQLVSNKSEFVGSLWGDEVVEFKNEFQPGSALEQ